MEKATDQLRKTHRVINKALEGFVLGDPRLPDIVNTLNRTIRAHASLQDHILAPALRERSLIDVPYLDDTEREHGELADLLTSLVSAPLHAHANLEAGMSEIRLMMEAHLRKEAKVLYPYAESVMDLETIYRLGDDMTAFKHSIVELIRR